MSETNTRTYELGFILAPTVAETEVASHVAAFKSAIEKGEGKVLSEGTPEFIDLAYTMEKSVASKKYKYSQGYFGWVKFEITPAAMEVLKKTLDGMKDLVRYILVKTNAENTIVFKKPKIEAKRATDEDEIIVEESDDELKEDHELLPDVAEDIADVQATPAPEEGEEKETM